MKKSLSKRETVLAVTTVVCLLLVVASGIYTTNLRAKDQRNSALLWADSALLEKKDTDSNKTANYTETICAEYRKLYQVYISLRSQNPSASATGYALPGSAKGEVDECYQP